MAVNSFVQAVDYVNLNQATWDRMIDSCYNQWAFELEPRDPRPFETYVLEKYGIRVNPLKYNSRSYLIADTKKYMLFQIEFSHLRQT